MTSIIGNFFCAVLLAVNAVAILHEERFLGKIGWGPQSAGVSEYGVNGPNASAKAKVIGLISAVRTLLRMPLIVINSLVIVYELLFG
ncbi:hypothetical protein RI367_008160 [Sorochytrium milnesiophthora]